MYPLGMNEAAALLRSSRNRWNEIRSLIDATGFYVIALRPPYPGPLAIEGVSVREGTVGAVQLRYHLLA